MSRIERKQLNIRSTVARKRAHELAALTGMTVDEIVEDALRGYVPPAATARVGKLVWRGPILVRPAAGRKVGLKRANATLDAVRAREN